MITPDVELPAGAVGRHYDDLDVFYREIWGEHVHHGLWLSGRETPAEAVTRLTELVAGACRISPGQAVCDVGCGYGATARFLAREKKAHVTGLTVSKAQYDYARNFRTRSPSRPVYLLRDWLANDLPDASFDAVLAIESLSHMKDPARFFAEIRRVLKPGGRWALTAWLAGERPRPWETRHLLRPICREGRLERLNAAGDCFGFMQAAGLEPDRFEDLTPKVKKTWTLCLRRLVRRVLTDRRYRHFLLNPANGNRVFAPSLLRIRLAYQTGAMRYGFFSGSGQG